MSIITEELQDVVVVPTTAIHYSGNATTVTLDSNGGTKVTQPVTIGAASGGNTQVTSGLTVGEKIYVTEVTFRGADWAPVPGAGLFGGGGGGFGGGGGGFGGGGGGGFGGGGGGGFGG